MDDVVRETIVASFSRIVAQRCDDRLVDCAVEHKVCELNYWSNSAWSCHTFAAKLHAS
jgi:hypothetical protein